MNLNGDFARIEAEALGLSVGEGEIFAIHSHGGRALDVVGEINAVALGDSESSFQVDCEGSRCESGGGRFSGFHFQGGHADLLRDRFSSRAKGRGEGGIGRCDEAGKSDE